MAEVEENTFDFTKKTWREDITFVLEEKRLYAAKNVLAMVSPVFETMFSSSFKEKDQEEISLPGKKFDDFHEFLKCTYPSLKDIDKVNVVMVLPLADEYQVSSLKRKCGEFLLNHLKNNISQMDKSEILRCYSMGLNYNIAGISELCIKRMCLHSEVELEEDNVKHMDKDTLVQYHNDMSAHLRGVHTKYIKLLMKMSNNLVGTETLIGLEHSTGITLEHTIANILDLSLQKPHLSKEVSVWNVKFQLITYIQENNDSRRGRLENYVAVFLRCIFPEGSNGWSCMVDARIWLTVGKSEKLVRSCELNDRFTSTKNELSVTTFRQMSELFADLNFKDDEYGKTVKIVAYLLVEKPVEELPLTSS